MGHCTMLAHCKYMIGALVFLASLICLAMMFYTGLWIDPLMTFTGKYYPNDHSLQQNPQQQPRKPDKMQNVKGQENKNALKYHEHIMPGRLHVLTQKSNGSNKSTTKYSRSLHMKRFSAEKAHTAVYHQNSLTKSQSKSISQGKVVLLWNMLYGKNFNIIGEHALMHTCPRSPKCTFTHNTTLLSAADAVVFHMWPADSWEFPKMRTANQQYVFLLNESPVRLDYHFEWYDHFFNLTMTYRRDSDIPFLYGNKYPRMPMVPLLEPWWLDEMAVMKGKKKLAVWIVGHCKTDSRREDYVEELKKYIKIDIYGHCGTLRCLPARSAKCYNLIRNNYRFVLAFENSACKDYITEKVYENLVAGVVPVVYGGANYEEMLPPHSYINVGDFASAKYLGNYLQRLMHDDVEYLKYFQWKRSFSVSTPSYEWKLSFCKLCEALHRPIHQHKSYSTDDLKAHWGPRNCDSNYLKMLLYQ